MTRMLYISFQTCDQMLCLFNFLQCWQEVTACSNLIYASFSSVLFPLHFAGTRAGHTKLGQRILRYSDFRRQMRFHALPEMKESSVSFTSNLLNRFILFQVVLAPNTKWFKGFYSFDDIIANLNWRWFLNGISEEYQHIFFSKFNSILFVSVLLQT